MKYLYRLKIAAVAVFILIVLAIILSGCAMNPMKRPAPVVEPVVVETSGRIDAKSVIDAANEAGCEMAVLLYSEGKKTSKIMVQCALGQPLPPAVRKGF